MPLFPVRRDAETAAFFDGTRRGEFLLVYDGETNSYLDPKTDVALDPDRLRYAPAAGTATVVSWSVVHGKGSDGPTRSVVGIVQFDEGPWWWTEIHGVDPDADLLGAPVRVEFVPSGHGETDEVIPVFVAAAESHP